jgi:hypothetical protein
MDIGEVAGVADLQFIADHKTYAFHAEEESEAWYLSAFLNAPFVDASIKPYQTRGSFGTRGGGERDIHRRPFEVVPIPRFNGADRRHLRLAEISEACHRTVAQALPPPQERIGTARQRVREALREPLTEIDAVVREILADQS